MTIDYVVNDVITTSRIAIESTASTTIDEVRRAGRPLIGFQHRGAHAPGGALRVSCVSTSIGTSGGAAHDVQGAARGT